MKSPISDRTPKVYLSRRNLLALLSKLDRLERGEETHCAIIKYQQDGAAYRQTHKAVMVIAVDDHEFYGSQNRPAGQMHPSDESGLPVPATGTWLDPI
jgi:hypothetical protein